MVNTNMKLKIFSLISFFTSFFSLSQQTSNSDVLVPTIAAEMNVSESGALTCTIPIELLKGLNSFQPNLALVYNSQGGNGQAGWGWNVTGISMISQGGKSKEIDGITIGPQFNANDPYYLDGQRLIKINETTYATEKYSKVKITKPVTGEYSFVVQYTDGKIAKYKELAEGQHYLIVFSDSFDNQIHYSYESNIATTTLRKNIRLTKISYGSTDVTNDPYYINFLYKTRANYSYGYRNGQLLTNEKILDKITSGSTISGLYRKYSITYELINSNTNAPLERVRKIELENEVGEKLKPLNFSYNTSTSPQVVSKSSLIKGFDKDLNGLGSVAVGDFFEPGKLEPIYGVKSKNGGYKMYGKKGIINLPYAITGKTSFNAGKVLFNDKITLRDALITITTEYPGDVNNPAQLNDEITFHINDLLEGSGRTIKINLPGGTFTTPPQYDDYTGNETTPGYLYRDMIERTYHTGDFNNDGLLDFLIFEGANDNRPAKVYFLEVGRTQSSTATAAILNVPADFTGRSFYNIEYDGDGIPEILGVSAAQKRFSVYKLNISSNTIETKLSSVDLFNTFGSKTPLFLGDFNGDGLTDFISPSKVYEADPNGFKPMGSMIKKMESETNYWYVFRSTGTSFQRSTDLYNNGDLVYAAPFSRNVIKKTSWWDKFYHEKFDEYDYTEYLTTSIVMADFNNDGRTDIISTIKIGKAKYSPDELLYKTTVDNLSNNVEWAGPVLQGGVFYSNITNKVRFLQNGLNGGSSQTFRPLSTHIPLEAVKISPLSLIIGQNDFNQLNTYSTGIYVYDPLIGTEKTFELNNDSFLEKHIQEVDNGSSVVQKVEYRPMIPNFSTAEAAYIYKPDSQLKYPYYTHNTNGSYYLAHKIHTLFDGKILTKEYRYENAVQHLEGKGLLGFQKTYTSDAYESVFQNNKYTIKDPFKGVFWNIQTKDPTMDNAVVLSTYGGIKKFFTENTIVNKRFDKGNHQYVILQTDEVSKDNLKKITISKKYVYDEADDLKLKTVYTDYNGIGSAISKYTYKPEFNNGTHYFYGKFASSENTTYKDGLSFTSKDETDYFPNGNPSQVRKYGNQSNAPPVVTSYTYDAFGNVISETLSTQGIAPMTTSYEYDSTNRYVKKTTRPDGLFSTANVNILGRLTSEVSSLGLNTFYTYDSWGNVIEITDFLGKKTNISKSVADASTGGVYNLHKKREGGTETIITFDKFDREIQAKAQSINGKWLVTKTEYDIFGRKVKVSEPFFEGEPVKWNTIEYDEQNRPVKNIAFTGKVITTCYEGMKVTVDEGNYKKTSKTLDAMGNVIRQQDHGGVLSYSYYPNGALKQTNYEGIITSFEIDGWGNKTKIIDPSAGTFTYEYDNLSRITKETTPKGYTLYTYDNLGRPVTEKTYGNTPAESTTIEKTYTYNGQTKLPETITGISNGKTFTYTTYYDNYYRITGKKEQTPDFTYTSNTTFDSFGRADVVSISTVLSSPNYTSNSSIKNIYDSNGILIQQNNADTGAMVWHLSSITAKGQTSQMEYGNGYTLVSQYNPTDFTLYNLKHQNTNNGTVVLDIDYNYDVNKGVLNWRRNNTFGKKEDFTYDNLNRLLSEALNGIIANQYTYDKRGRITSNTELGKYNYNESDYKLQSINFNANGQNVNTQRGFANITYNAFKSPLRIELLGKEDLSFDYNILKTRYSMRSAVTGQQKFYSSDFAVEIIKDNGGKTQLITYITGDPYSANYIKKEILTNSTLTEKANYYLHRDNLGSILAITKADGSVVEKRFFDAWGNLKGLVNNNGQTITDSQQLQNYNFFIDRGYTGHEHLWKAGLINMNARLYDPILRKFLSPDNLVPDPFNTQSYDRFSYAVNNPLLYIDIDGNEPVVTAMLVALAIGITTKAISNMINGIPFWYGLGKAAVMSAASGLISFGIGSAATTAFGQTLTFGKALFEAGMHAYSSGIMSAIEGGKFGSGALSGAISSLMASGVQALGTNFAASKKAGHTVYNGFGQDYMKATMIVTGGLGGGISSSIAGGNFWNGFRQGVITSGLNHAMHEIGNDSPFDDGGGKDKANVYIETDGVGHVYVEIDGTVYSYGRYNGSYSPSSGKFGPYGDGVLLRLDGDNATNFIAERTAKYPTSTYSVDVDGAKVKAYYNKLYNSGKPLQGKEGFYKYGRVVDTYTLMGPGGNNCTTITYKALNYGGANMGAPQTPAGMLYNFRQAEYIRRGYNPGLWGPKQ